VREEQRDHRDHEPADQQAAHHAAAHVAGTITQFGSGETSSSSMCLPNLAPKNDDTTLP
jgi:hypothetical protein